MGREKEIMNHWNRTRRMRTLALLPAILCLGAAAAEAQESRVDVFGGAGLLAGVREPRPTANLGTNVWIFRRWGASVRHTIAARGDDLAVVTEFGIRYRIDVDGGRTMLHVGGSPAGFSIDDDGYFEAGVSAVFDVFVGRQISRRVGAGIGISTLIGPGAFINPVGLVVWSFD